MIWLLLRAAIYFVALAALAFGISLMLDTPGGIEITWNGRAYLFDTLSFAGLLIVFVIAVWIAWKALGLLIAVVNFFTGDETAISRFFHRSRQRRGVEALTAGLLALARGDARTAGARAERAGRLLDKPELANLVGAQAARLAGDRERAEAALKALARDERTRVIGVKGLLELAMEKGESARALKLAERAFALDPRDGEIMARLFDLQAGAGEWAAARRTLAAEVRAGILPREVGARRDAVLALAEARAAEEAGDVARARAAALEAVKRAPALAPAAVAAARRLGADGSPRKGEKILRRAWKMAPHPDIAAAFAALHPEESPEERRRRFAALIAENRDHPESRLLEAELALAAEDFPAARRALGDLAETRPTTRSLAVMAAIERGSGADEQVVRAWLAKALSAPRGERWTCEACGHVHDEWAPVCANCKAVDSLSWKQPEGGGESAAAEAAMLPLIMGAIGGERAGRAPEDAPEAEVVDISPDESQARGAA